MNSNGKQGKKTILVQFYDQVQDVCLGNGPFSLEPSSIPATGDEVWVGLRIWYITGREFHYDEDGKLLDAIVYCSGGTAAPKRPKRKPKSE
jgi:hypothetical protein